MTCECGKCGLEVPAKVPGTRGPNRRFHPDCPVKALHYAKQRSDAARATYDRRLAAEGKVRRGSGNWANSTGKPNLPRGERKICWTCADMSHRRPLNGCHECGEPFEELPKLSSVEYLTNHYQGA